MPATAPPAVRDAASPRALGTQKALPSARLSLLLFWFHWRTPQTPLPWIGTCENIPPPDPLPPTGWAARPRPGGGAAEGALQPGVSGPHGRDARRSEGSPGWG